jgi:hypothetical protein
MSFQVTQLVRAARLPRTMKRRPEAKGVLLALADRANDDGVNAWPSEATIAAEAEIGVRTARLCLTSLRDLGLIGEQEPPAQHRPRTWYLDLDAITRLSDRHDHAELTSNPDRQHVAGLNADDASSDRQNHESGRQIETPDRQNREPGRQHVADELREQSFERKENSGASFSLFIEEDTRKREKALTFLKGHAFDVLACFGDDDFETQFDALEQLAEEHGVDCNGRASVIADALAFAKERMSAAPLTRAYARKQSAASGSE